MSDLDKKLKEAQQSISESLMGKQSVFASNKVNFSPRQTNMSRYLTYGASVYGQLGFDPLRDNNAFYNANTGASSDISRAVEGSLKLAKIGFSDTFAFGVGASKSASLDFERTMNDYSSTKGGLTGLFSNTLLSSGYTAGILGAIATEEVILTGLTALTGGAGGVGQALETGSLFARAANALDNTRQISKSIKAIEELSKVKTARNFLKGSLNSLNPIENTIQFAKDFKSLDNINGLSKVLSGSGALVRDARKLYMTHSESKLEAELAESEFFKKEYSKAASQSSDGSVSDDKVEDIKNKSNQVYNKIYTGNLGLIYSTNAITFDNMFKTMKGTNRFFNQADNGLFKKVINKETGEVTIEALKKPISGFKKYLIEEGKSLTTVKGLSKKLLASSMEGFQEVGQDVLSNSVKNYYTNSKEVNQVKGGFLNQLFDDLDVLTDANFLNEVGESSKKMLSQEGLETFLSGALMGAFSTPVGLATQGVNSFLFEGGISELRNNIKNSEEFKKAKEQKFKNRQLKAVALTEFFNRKNNFVDFVDHPVFSQHSSQSDMMDDLRTNDNLSFKNNQETSFGQGLWTMLESGMHSEFKDHLLHMADEFNVSEMQEVFGRTDINENNINDFRQKLYSRADKVDYYKQKYDLINQNLINPIKLDGLDPESSEFKTSYLKWKAYESLKKDALLAEGALSDRIDRLSELQSDLSNSVVTDKDFISQLYNEDLLDTQIELLKVSNSANEQLNLSEEDKKILTQSKQKLENLQEYSNNLKKFKTSLLSGDNTQLYKKELMKSFLKVTDTNNKTNNKEETFNKLADYITLSAEKNSYTKFIDSLNTFTSFETLARKKYEIFSEIDNNKKSYIEQALKDFDEKQVSDKMLNELYSSGIFFDLKELDDLLKDGQLPSVFYNINTSKTASSKQKQTAIDIIKTYIEDLKNLDLIDSQELNTNSVGKKLNSDNRTVSDTLSQYSIKLNEVLDLSSEKGKDFIQEIIDSPYSFTADELILDKALDSYITLPKLIFVENSGQAIDYNSEEDIFYIDLAYTGSNYTNSQTTIESLVVRSLSQKFIDKSLNSIDSEIISEVMQEVKNFLKDKIPVDYIPFLNNSSLFFNEALNNLEFQKMLSSLELSSSLTNNSSWSELFKEIETLLDINFSGKALDKILGLLNNTFDQDLFSGEKISDQEQIISSEETNKVDDLYSKLIKLKEDKRNPNITRKEKKRLDREITQTAFELNSLMDKIEENVDQKEPVYQTSFPESEKIVENHIAGYDVFGNYMINSTTPWSIIPLELKEKFSQVYYQKNSNRLTAKEISFVLEEIKENPAIQQMMVDYNNKTTYLSELKQNNEAVRRNVDFRQNINKTLKETKKKVNKVSFTQNLKNVLGENFNLLSEQELILFQEKLNNKNFSFQDILTYVAEKSTTSSVSEKIVGRLNYFENNFNIDNNTFKYLSLLNSDLFLLSEQKYVSSLKNLISLYKSDIKNFELDLESGDIREKIEYVFSLEESGKLYPVIAEKINKYFSKNNIPLVISLNRKTSIPFYTYEYSNKKIKKLQSLKSSNKNISKLINFLNSPEGKIKYSSIMEQQKKYYLSDEFLIEKGLYNETLFDLNENQKDLFLTAINKGVYPISNIDNAVLSLSELDDKINGILSSDLYKENDFETLENLDSLQAQKEVLIEKINTSTESEIIDQPNEINSGNEFEYNSIRLNSLEIKDVKYFINKEVGAININTSLDKILSLLSFVKTKYPNDFSYLKKELLKNIDIDNFNSKPILYNGEIMFIQNFKFDSVTLSSVNGDLKNISLDIFINNFDKSLLPGEKINSSNVDSLIKSNQISSLKNIFSEILNNFDDITPSENIEEEIKIHIKNCL